MIKKKKDYNKQKYEKGTLKENQKYNFGIAKCAMLEVKSGKRHMTGVELPNQETLRTLGQKERVSQKN